MNEISANQTVGRLDLNGVSELAGWEGKKVYFEFMRVFACGLVIFNHLPGYSLYISLSGYKQFFYMCLTMFTRINVPLFWCKSVNGSVRLYGQ